MEKSVAKFTLLALPLFALTACQDYEPFSEAEVHEHFVHKNFNDSFVNTFGEIAPDHHWGFDYAEGVLNSEMSVKTRANLSQGYVYKQEETIQYGSGGSAVFFKTTDLYGRPADITQHEHEEVYAWFTNHRVDWKNTPTNSYIDAEHSRETNDGGTNIVAHVINSENPDYGSLKDYPTINPLTDPYVDDNSIHFYNGWIQQVARDERYDEHDQDTPAHSYNCTAMDYLAFRHVGNIEDWIHLKDFNQAYGYGWGRQPSTDGSQYQIGDPSNGQNAILVLDAKFDVVTYGCNTGSSTPHNKYYIVYLKGDDYEGYYLGMDLESYTDGTANMSVPADGICNDWIIKIGDAGAKPFNPTRVMCEDLAMVNCDYDYNDIVYDVEYKDDVATITVQAAGGTVPISIWYDGTQLKLEDNGGTETGEIHTLFGAPIETPVNVGAPGVTKNSVVFKLKFKDTSNGTATWQLGPSDGWKNHKYAYYSSSNFNFQSIQVKVKHNIEAEWVNLNNIDGDAPVRFCVPNTVKWTKELQGIEKAYPGFRTWVGNPTDMFWTSGKTINSEYLYN